MAKRAGKYKLTKRDSATSLVDGGVATSTIKARGYVAKNPSVMVKWPAHTGDLGSGGKTITIAQILTGIYICDPTADAAHTLPTAALAVAGVTSVAVGDCIDFSVINTGTASEDEIITLAAGSGGTLVGSGAVLTANPVDNAFSSGSGTFRIRFTNVTAGSEAYSVYRLA
jgi:hypothetical protein